MFGSIKTLFIGLLIRVANTSNHKRCVLLSNLKYIIQPILVSLYPNEYSQQFHYYPFVVKLDRCVRSSNTLNDLSI